LHPEVKYIGLLTLLYAGTALLLNFNYSILNNIVKILKKWSKSAGNIIFYKNDTSETLRNEIIIEEKIKSISDHVPKHKKPLNDEEFGHYLAGLIDGNGYFSKQQLIFVFHSLNVSLAYYIKQYLGYGKVKKVKDAYILVIVNIEGLKKAIKLINGKIRLESKYNQIKNNVFSDSKYIEFSKEIDLQINLNKSLENHWLAGFSDANANFQIKIIEPAKVRLNYNIDLKENSLLLLIKDFLGGNISYIKSQDIYKYNSISFGSARNVINYFDKYHLLSSKHINYLKWRKAYIIIQKKEYLTEKRIEKIIKLKKSIDLLYYNLR
jgi:hypothetical protein